MVDSFLLETKNWDQEESILFSNYDEAVEYAQSNFFQNFKIINWHTKEVLFEYDSILDDAQKDIKRYKDSDDYARKMRKMHLDSIAANQRQMWRDREIEQRQKLRWIKESKNVNWMKNGF